MERRLAAILAADVVGYSSLIGTDEEGTLTALKSLRVNFVEPLIADHRGRVVKLMGDGFLVEFQSAVDAVKCAVAWQQGTAEGDNATELMFRIGVNLGDIVIDGDDILGDGVNIAARLESVGAPGHVLISGDVHHQIDGRLDEKFHEIGPVELKNIVHAVPVWSWPEPVSHLVHVSDAGLKPGIHVAQFEARGAEAAELAEAIQDDLVTTFARQSGVGLITEFTAADYLVSGTIRGAGDRWRISASLIDQVNDQMVWSERFDEAGDDLFNIQDRCVARIAGAIRIRLPSLLSTKLARKSLHDMSVQDLLNHAMNRHFTPTKTSWDQAVPALELALERDCDNWMAMTMLCFNMFSKTRIFGWRRTTAADEKVAHELIERAQVLKTDSEVVRMVHGAFLLYVMRDHSAARIEAEASLKLNPNYYHSIDLMSQIELFAGDIGQAMEFATRSVDCDPGYPYLHLYQRDLGCVYAISGMYADAADMFRRADRAAAGLPQNLIGIAACAQLGGDTDGASRTVASLLELESDFNLEEYEPWPFRDLSNWASFQNALAAAGAPGSLSTQ